jgi:Alternative complex III, ActD subunit
MKKRVRTPTYGLMAEFETPTDVVAAARRVHEEGYRRIDAFSPYPIEELSEAIGVHSTKMPMIVLIGGIVGLIAGYLMQYYTHVVDYPLNVGGKPFHSWPQFIPITFETTVLGAALSAVFGMLALNGLPEPYHPVFNTPNFALASRDRFFLLVEARDPKFDREQTAAFLRTLGPREVTDVEH